LQWCRTSARAGMYTHPKAWRRIVDSSKFILKVVLLHNRNIHLSVLTTHSVHMKETYENLDLLLKATSYSKYWWNICEDSKVLGLLLGTQSGYTKVCCFLCEWDSRAIDKHYKIEDWPTRENSVSGKKFVRHQLLVGNDKLFFKCHSILHWGL